MYISRQHFCLDCRRKCCLCFLSVGILRIPLFKSYFAFHLAEIRLCRTPVRRRNGYSMILHPLGFAHRISLFYLLIFACKLQIPLDFDSEIYYNIYVYIIIMERALFARWKAEKRES